MLNVSRSGYYEGLSRLDSPRRQENELLLKQIREIHEESRGTYGSPRVHAELTLGLGLPVNVKRVARLMREAGIQGLYRRRRHGCTIRDADPQPSADLVNRQFTVDAPNRLSPSLPARSGPCPLPSFRRLPARGHFTRPPPASTPAFTGPDAPSAAEVRKSVDVEQLKDAGDVRGGLDFDVRSAIAVGGGVADEGADPGRGEERHATQVNTHGGRWRIGERAQRGGENVEVGHLDLAVDVQAVRRAAQPEAMFLEPVGVASDGQVEVLSTRAVACTAPVVDAQHRHPVITTQAGQRRLDLDVGFPGGSADHRVGPDEDAQPVVTVGAGALQQLGGPHGGVEILGSEGSEPASGPASVS